jgi:hypothetical protein
VLGPLFHHDAAIFDCGHLGVSLRIEHLNTLQIQGAGAGSYCSQSRQGQGA